MKIKNLFKGEGFVNFSSSILAIVCGLLFGLIILLISNPSQAFGGFMMIIQGGFTDGMQGFGQVLYMATPLIMTGLSVGFAFKTGLFNIGASGQFTAGAFAAVYVGVKFTFLPPGVHCLAALLAAILAGALWGMVPGLLKAFFNVNEVISSIMMNYIGMYLTNMLIQNTVYDQVKKIQPICFENACWAYTVGAAIAIKKGCRRAADAAAAIGEGLQAFCIPGSVADTRKVGLGHGNLGKMLLEEETECFAFLAGHESFAAAEGAIGIARKSKQSSSETFKSYLKRIKEKMLHRSFPELTDLHMLKLKWIITQVKLKKYSEILL